MAWVVEFFDAFEAEFDAFPDEVQDAILVRAALLEREGPQLGRPPADTLSGSRHANMKEPEVASGASPSPWIPTGRPFSWRRETSPAEASGAFIGS